MGIISISIIISILLFLGVTLIIGFFTLILTFIFKRTKFGKAYYNYLENKENEFIKKWGDK